MKLSERLATTVCASLLAAAPYSSPPAAVAFVEPPASRAIVNLPLIAIIADDKEDAADFMSAYKKQKA